MDNTIEWIDITVPPHPALFEGLDTLPIDGERINLVKGRTRSEGPAISRSSYVGTQVDAPWSGGAEGSDQAPMRFSAIIGLAKVIEIHDKKSVKVEELKKHRFYAKERILLKTKNSAQLRETIPRHEECIHLDPSAASWLVERRISTVGIDALITRGSHRRPHQGFEILQEAGIWIIQCLDLRLVKSGEYMLICLPLKVRGIDGGPARAILQRTH
ncbi:MAG: cyclase family protein [Nitrospirales bacterium]|nr:cyclase family protein [Nitrospirales bacterium]